MPSDFPFLSDKRKKQIDPKSPKSDTARHPAQALYINVKTKQKRTEGVVCLSNNQRMIPRSRQLARMLQRQTAHQLTHTCRQLTGSTGVVLAFGSLPHLKKHWRLFVFSRDGPGKLNEQFHARPFKHREREGGERNHTSATAGGTKDAQKKRVSVLGAWSSLLLCSPCLSPSPRLRRS